MVALAVLTERLHDRTHALADVLHRVAVQRAALSIRADEEERDWMRAVHRTRSRADDTGCFLRVPEIVPHEL